jgi:hypothetical protein
VFETNAGHDRRMAAFAVLAAGAMAAFPQFGLSHCGRNGVNNVAAADQTP